MKRLLLILLAAAAFLLLQSCGRGSGDRADGSVANGSVASGNGSGNGSEGAPPENTQHPELSQDDAGSKGSEQSGSVSGSASWASITRIGEAEYEIIVWPSRNEGDSGLITPGEVVGVCEWNMPRRNRAPASEDNVTISSTVFEEGEEIYKWSGYDPSFRICGYVKGVGVVGQQRTDDAFHESLWVNRMTPADIYNDFTDNVASIVIRSFNYGNEMGRIVDLSVIKTIMSAVLSLEYTEDAMIQAKQARYNIGSSHTVEFQLLNGLTNTLILYAGGGGYALFGGFLQLPEDVVSTLLTDSVIFSGERLNRNSLGRGIVSGLDYYDPDYDGTNHVMWDAYIDSQEGSALYICPYMFFNRRYLADPGPVSNLQRSGNYLYYLNSAGEIVRVMTSGVRDESFLYERLEAGAEIRDFLEFEVFCDNDVSSFRIIGREIYFTDHGGTLYRANLGDMDSIAEIAADVSDYAPDEDAVTYLSGGALYRAYPDRTIILEPDGVKCFAPGMIYLYYSKDGGVFRVSVAGGNSERIFDMDAAILIYSNLNLYTDGFACIEDVTGACKIIFVTDETYEFIIVEEGAAAAGFYAEDYFLLITDTEIYRVCFSAYWEKSYSGSNWLPEYDMFLYDRKTALTSSRH